MLLIYKNADGVYNLVGGSALLLSPNYLPVKVPEGMDVEVLGGVVIPPHNVVAVNEEEKKFLQSFVAVLELFQYS